MPEYRLDTCNDKLSKHGHWLLAYLGKYPCTVAKRRQMEKLLSSRPISSIGK